MHLPSHTPSHIPHALRLSIFFLRLALGLNFFYLGYTSLFNEQLGEELRTRSLTTLYSWLGTYYGNAWLVPFAKWAFLIIGACLIVGFATRLASLVALALLVASFLPHVNLSSFTQFVDDHVVMIFGVVILFISNAGTYLGLDRFFHFSLRGKK